MPSGAGTAYLAVFALVVASRLASTVYYVEDTDSLRFALSVRDYSVAELRPHFPGYPVFAFLAKALTALTGSYAVAFSLLGAVATFGILYYLQRFVRTGPTQALGLLLAALVFFNPMVWLLGNRYMPDLLGAAFALAAVYHLLQGKHELGFLLTGLLAGVRLSYLPFVLVPVLLALRPRPFRGLGFGALGVLVWFVPLVLDTGWGDLIAAAWKQTEGHFAEFGGTVYTEPGFAQRAGGLLQGIWAHGLGAYWPARHPITLLVGAGAIVTLAAGVRPLRQAVDDRIIRVLAASWTIYLLWIFFYQNVIHNSRHVLPLLPLVLLIVALGTRELVHRARIGQAMASVFLAAYFAVALVLVDQHRRPTAIAQVAEQLRAERVGELHVVSIPLANFYLSALGVDARFVSTETPAPLPPPAPGVRVVAVGTEPAWARRPTSVRVFYHNPFVNPLWPEIVVREYASVLE